MFALSLLLLSFIGTPSGSVYTTFVWLSLTLVNANNDTDSTFELYTFGNTAVTTTPYSSDYDPSLKLRELHVCFKFIMVKSAVLDHEPYVSHSMP